MVGTGTSPFLYPNFGHGCPKPPTSAHLREGDRDRRLTEGDRRFTGGELRRGDFRFTEGDLRRRGDRRLIGGDALLTGDPERMRFTGGDRSLPGEPLLAEDLRRTEGERRVTDERRRRGGEGLRRRRRAGDGERLRCLNWIRHYSAVGNGGQRCMHSEWEGRGKRGC